MATDKNCPYHDKHEAQLDDHEERLRDKRDRILKLELEASHMRNTMQTIVSQNKEIKEALDGLRAWQLYLMGGVGAVGVVYSLLSSHWSSIVRIFGGG